MDPKHRLFFQRCPLSLDMALVARVPELRGRLLVPNLYLKSWCSPCSDWHSVKNGVPVYRAIQIFTLWYRRARLISS